jgi:hypothetical protein
MVCYGGVWLILGRCPQYQEGVGEVPSRDTRQGHLALLGSLSTNGDCQVRLVFHVVTKTDSLAEVTHTHQK